MSWVTLAESIEILSQELGYDAFTARSEFEKKSDIKVTTSGLSNTLQRVGSEDLTTILSANDEVLIDSNPYKVQSVSTDTFVIDTAINLATETIFYYVVADDLDSWNAFILRKTRALTTAYKEIKRNLIDPDLPVDDSLREAQSKLAAIFYSNLKSLPNSKKDVSNIQSEKIGDISTNYDSSKAVESLPGFIIEILGPLYKSNFDPVFFQR